MELIQEQLLSLLSHSLFDRPTDVVITDELLNEAKLQAVSSLVTDKDYCIYANNIRVNAAHADLTKVLKDIPFVTMKGFASAYYYPNPDKRPMGDVDFYVSPSDYEKASDTLLNNGFKPLNHEHERHEAFSKGKVIFELHSEIKGIPNGKDGIKTDSKTAEAKVRTYLSDVIETSIKVSTQHGEVIIPDDLHHGIIMLLHVAGHMINDGGVGLRHLCDWAVYADKVDPEIFKHVFEDIGLWTFARQLTAVCVKYLGLREMTWIGQWNDRFLKTLMDDIVSGGNFGIKGNTPGTVNRLTSDDSISEKIKKRFPVVENHPVLLPGAIVYWGCRYMVRCITGKRKKLKTSDFKAGKERHELYKQFRLFE